MFSKFFQRKICSSLEIFWERNLRREEKRSSSQLFLHGKLQLIQEIVAAPCGVIQKEVGERIVFGGEDGSIIKENFEFVKNGKKDGQKGQGEDFRYVKHKEFWFDFLGGVWYSIDAQESRKEVEGYGKDLEY